MTRKYTSVLPLLVISNISLTDCLWWQILRVERTLPRRSNAPHAGHICCDHARHAAAAAASDGCTRGRDRARCPFSIFAVNSPCVLLMSEDTTAANVGYELVDPGVCALMMPSKATVIQANPLALLRCTGVHAPAWEKMGEVGRARFHDGRPTFHRADPNAVAPLSHGEDVQHVFIVHLHRV